VSESITRIDLQDLPTGLFVKKYADGWNETSRPIEMHTQTDPSWTLDKACEWLRSQGWNVRRWYKGARAFKGPLRHVRTESEVKSLRARLQRNRDLYSAELQLHTLELFYDW